MYTKEKKYLTETKTLLQTKNINEKNTDKNIGILYPIDLKNIITKYCEPNICVVKRENKTSVEINCTLKQFEKMNKRKIDKITIYGNIQFIDPRDMFRESTIKEINCIRGTIELVGDCTHMFFDARKFNCDINSWNAEKVTDISYMFCEARDFKYDINNWNLDNVLESDYVFDIELILENKETIYVSKHIFDEMKDCKSIIHLTVYGFMTFNNPKRLFENSLITTINSLNGLFELVGNCSYMFHNAINFTGDVKLWNVTRVTNMSHMFHNATNFNTDVLTWDVSNVTNMSHMFHNATKFNGRVRYWEVQNTMNMDYMFYGVKNSNIHSYVDNWYIPYNTTTNKMFN